MIAERNDKHEDYCEIRPDTCFDFVPDPALVSKEGMRLLYERHPEIRFPDRSDPNLPTVEEVRTAYVSGQLTNPRHEFNKNLLLFEDDVKSFYIACGYITGSTDEAEKIIMHELQHARELARHDVPFSFSMMFARNPNGSLRFFPSVIALYPSYFTAEDRKNVQQAVLKAVEAPSEEDSLQLAHQNHP